MNGRFIAHAGAAEQFRVAVQYLAIQPHGRRPDPKTAENLRAEIANYDERILNMTGSAHERQHALPRIVGIDPLKSGGMIVKFP